MATLLRNRVFALNGIYLNSRVSSLLVDLLATTSHNHRVSQLPAALPSTSNCTQSDHMVWQVSEMVQNFLSLESKDDRLDYAKENELFTKLHHLGQWRIKGVSDVYDNVASEIPSFTVDEMVSLIRHLQYRDPLVKLLASNFRKRVNELNMDNAIYLCQTFIHAGMIAQMKSIFEKLKEMCLMEMKKDAYIEPRKFCQILALLRKARHISMRTVEEMAVYLSRHLYRFDLESATMAILLLVKTKHLIHARDRQFLDSVNTYFLEFLHRSSNKEDRADAWNKNYGYFLSKYISFFGLAKLYNKEVFDKITELFINEHDTEIHNPLFVTSLTVTCGKVRYYNKVLLDHIVDVSLNKLESFYMHQLSSILSALSSLNYKHKKLLTEVEKMALMSQSSLDTCELYWNIIRSSIFMNDYSLDVLKRFLTDDMMQVSERNGIFKPLCLLRLLVSLTFEQPQLGYATIPDRASQFGIFPYHFTSISDKYIHASIAYVIRCYHRRNSSAFGVNFCRALKGATGRGYFTFEPLSFNGYCMDFEILMDKDNRPIPIPYSWRCTPIPSILKSIGMSDDHVMSHRYNMLKHTGNCTVDDIQMKRSMPSLLEGLKNSEREVQSDVMVNLPLHYTKHGWRSGFHINLASDWGEYFFDHQDYALERVARRIAFEINGPLHYAVNDPTHVVGKDIVKKRLLEVLGWDVINVPYYEWSELKTGDDQIEYVAEKLYNCRTK